MCSAAESVLPSTVQSVYFQSIIFTAVQEYLQYTAKKRSRTVHFVRRSAVPGQIPDVAGAALSGHGHLMATCLLIILDALINCVL